MKRIARAKVARIISDHEVAFNQGKNYGIEEGDQVTISDRVEIEDPDTKESLGAVLVPRLRLSVSLVGERYCLATVSDRIQTGVKSAIVVGGAPRKKVTDDPWVAETEGYVLVAQGEEGDFKRTVPEPDEPPF